MTAQVFCALVAFSRVGYDEKVALLFAARLPPGPASATIGLADAVTLLEGLVRARARAIACARALVRACVCSCACVCMRVPLSECACVPAGACVSAPCASARLR